MRDVLLIQYADAQRYERFGNRISPKTKTKHGKRGHAVAYLHTFTQIAGCSCRPRWGMGWRVNRIIRMRRLRLRACALHNANTLSLLLRVGQEKERRGWIPIPRAVAGSMRVGISVIALSGYGRLRRSAKGRGPRSSAEENFCAQGRSAAGRVGSLTSMFGLQPQPPTTAARCWD